MNYKHKSLLCCYLLPFYYNRQRSPHNGQGQAPGGTQRRNTSGDDDTEPGVPAFNRRGPQFKWSEDRSPLYSRPDSAGNGQEREQHRHTRSATEERPSRQRCSQAFAILHACVQSSRPLCQSYRRTEVNERREMLQSSKRRTHACAPFS